MAKYNTGQNVTVKKSGAETHIVAQDGNGRYILQNGDNVYEREIEPTQPKPKKRGFLRRGK